MIKTVRTNSDHPDFIALVKLLDAELAALDGEDHFFYAKLNRTDKIKHVILAYQNGQPSGCGAIREYEMDTTEVKRMYVLVEHRNKGIASIILSELESWAKELKYKRCVLETGKRQPEAIALYIKSGYQQIPNYGKYAGVENSVCFMKELN